MFLQWELADDPFRDEVAKGDYNSYIVRFIYNFQILLPAIHT